MHTKTATATATATASADPAHLPNPKHISRVPLTISTEQLGRIRQSAFALPQVVKPADYVTEGSKGFELHLDKLGFVLLQKPVSGARPSRWIEPALMASAVAHLDALGLAATTPEARLMMVERTAALEGLGLTRRAGQWTRLVSHTLGLAKESAASDWQVPVDRKSVE